MDLAISSSSGAISSSLSMITVESDDGREILTHHFIPDTEPAPFSVWNDLVSSSPLPELTQETTDEVILVILL